MPSIDVAMARSVRGGVGGIIARSLQAAFEKRDVVAEAATSISSVKESFSSWDNCMAAVYCKWPVIGVIILGSLLILSIIWCISRCLCCGLSCCCECCHCLKCCGECFGCCDPPGKGRRHKHLDEPYNTIPDAQGYKREDPMATSALPFDQPRPMATAAAGAGMGMGMGVGAKAAEPPQYASFDVSKHADGKEDELPAMPVWGDSESKKVQLEQEAMELQHLKPPGAAAAGVVDSSVPLMNGMSPAGTPGTRTPVQGGGPYGPPPGAQGAVGAGGYGMGGAPAMGPYGGGAPGQGYGQNAYGQSTTSFHTEQSWGVTPGGPMPMGQQQQQQEYGQRQGPYAQHQPQQQGYGQPAGYAQEPGGYGEQPGYGAQPGYGEQQQQAAAYGQPSYGEYGANNMAAAGIINQQGGYRQPPARSMTGGSTAAASMRGAFPPPDRHGSPAPSQVGVVSHERAFDPRIMPQRTASPAQGAFDPRSMPQRTQSPAQSAYDPRQRPSPPQQQGGFDPRSMPPQQQQQSPPQQQGAFDPRSTQAPMQGGGGYDQRGMMMGGGPQRTASPAQQPFPGGPQRTYSPAPPPPQQQHQRSYSPAPQGQHGYRGPPQRQMTSDTVQSHRHHQQQQRGGPGGLPPRAPPYRQGSEGPGAQRQQFSNSPRPGPGARMPPSRAQTVDRPEQPRENFSRPMRSNTYDQQQQDGDGGAAAYPGYKPYQPGR